MTVEGSDASVKEIFEHKTSIKCVKVCFPWGLKLPEREANHFYNSNSEVKNVWISTSSTPHTFSVTFTVAT